jgi:uncharacterized FlaG/YvyC family protein
MNEVVIFKAENIKHDLELNAKELGITVSQLMRKITTDYLEGRRSKDKKSYNSSHLFIGFDNMSDKEVANTIKDINQNRKNDDRNINFDF